MTENSPTIARFEDHDMEIIDRDGQRWVTAKQLGDALGYDDHRNLLRLIDRTPDEFEGKQGVVKLTTPGGEQENRVLNYRGVIRAAMKSDAPHAVRFRDWAEEVLFQVMTTGSYTDPVEVCAKCARKDHWTDQLSPSEKLKLAAMRMRVIERMMREPENEIWFSMFLETYGGRFGYSDYLQSRGQFCRISSVDELADEVLKLRKELGYGPIGERRTRNNETAVDGPTAASDGR